MEENYTDNGFVVAELNKEVSGLCRYKFDNSRYPEIRKGDCELCAIYIRPYLKGKWIGTKPFEYVKRDFKIVNKNNMILWCLKNNKKYRKFYIKMGGQIVIEQKVKIGNKEYLEVWFLYDLN